MLRLNSMVSEYKRELILSKQEDLTYLSMIRSNLTDDDLLELAELVKKNPYIKFIDLDFNPHLTKAGVISMKQNLPGVEIINADCFKSIDQLMEESTRTFKLSTVPLRFTTNLNSSKKAETQVQDRTQTSADTDQQNSIITTNIF